MTTLRDDEFSIILLKRDILTSIVILYFNYKMISMFNIISDAEDQIY